MGRAALCALVLLLASAAELCLAGLDGPESQTGPSRCRPGRDGTVCCGDSGKSPAGRSGETRLRRGPRRAGGERKAKSSDCQVGQTTAQPLSNGRAHLDYLWIGIPAMGAAFICSFCVPYIVFRLRDWLRFRKLLRTLNDQLQQAQKECIPHALLRPVASGAAPGGPAASGATPGGPAASGATPGGPVASGATPGGPAASGAAPGGLAASKAVHLSGTCTIRINNEN